MTFKAYEKSIEVLRVHAPGTAKAIEAHVKEIMRDRDALALRYENRSPEMPSRHFAILDFSANRSLCDVTVISEDIRFVNDRIVVYPSTPSGHDQLFGRARPIDASTYHEIRTGSVEPGDLVVDFKNDWTHTSWSRLSDGTRTAHMQVGDVWKFQPIARHYLVELTRLGVIVKDDPAHPVADRFFADVDLSDDKLVRIREVLRKLRASLATEGASTLAE